MKATIGRIVHVLGFHDDETKEVAAIIADVHPDESEYDGDLDPANYPNASPLRVTLTAFPPLRTPQLAGSVPLFDSREEAAVYRRRAARGGGVIVHSAFWPERV